MDFHFVLFLCSFLKEKSTSAMFDGELFYRHLPQQVQRIVSRRSDYIYSKVALHLVHLDLKKNELIILYNSTNSPSIALIL